MKCIFSATHPTNIHCSLQRVHSHPTVGWVPIGMKGRARAKWLINFPHVLISYLSILMLFSCTGKHTSTESSTADQPDTLSFQHTVIDSLGPENPWAKIIGDIDGDGAGDIIIGGQNGPLVWYQYPDWEKFLIVEGGYETVDGEAGDIDDDGDLDIVMGGLFWYENPGSGVATTQASWITHQIADHPTHDVELGDMDGDGSLDVVTRDQSAFGSKAGNQIYVWLQRRDGWERQVIDCPHGEGIDVANIDGDQDPDIVIGGVWYENEQTSWVEHVFAEWHPNADVKVADLNRDGRQDILLTPSELKESLYKISWFAQPAAADGDWQEYLIQDSTEAVVHGAEVADFNKDGWPDIVAAEMHQGYDPDEVMVFINPQEGTLWEKIIVATRGSHLIQAADIDKDGDIDIMGANWSGDYQPVELWENQLNKKEPAQ